MSIKHGIKIRLRIRTCPWYVAFLNLVVDLLQETHEFFAARVKSESDSGLKQAEKKNYVGGPLAKLWLFASVSGTDTTTTKEIKYFKNISGGTPCKIPVIIFS